MLRIADGELEQIGFDGDALALKSDILSDSGWTVAYYTNMSPASRQDK